jgi:hypothetical protein
MIIGPAGAAGPRGCDVLGGGAGTAFEDIERHRVAGGEEDVVEEDLLPVAGVCQRPPPFGSLSGMGRGNHFLRFGLTAGAVFLENARVLRALGLPLMAVAMFSLLGGHWAILQAVAWSQMVRDFSQNVSLGVAVEKALSGEYPCALCKRVAEGRQREQQAPLAKLEKQSVEIVPEPALVIARPVAGRFSYPPAVRVVLKERFDAPPRPVPRGSIG